MNIKYRYKMLLSEGYNFTNDDEVYEALKANKIGVKVLPEYKDSTKWDYTCEKLKTFFRKCGELDVKNTTYGVQLLLSKVTPYTLEEIIRSDGLYELLRSYKKPWVKELKEYQTLMNEKVWQGATVNDLQKLEKAIQEEQSKHGKVSKGSGQLKDVETVYDDGTWKLMIPSSFEGEKAAAYYIKDGKEVPTAWCTRVEKYYYERYTQNGPLYIIRNMKNGKSYQMAFEEDDGYSVVHFLDQDDTKGDEITMGDLSKIPNELLKNIPISVGKAKHKTMADYKTEKASPDPDANTPGYADSTKTTWTKEQIVDKKYQRKVAIELDEHQPTFSRNPNNNYLSRYHDRDIVKIATIKGTEPVGRDELTAYVRKGKKEEHKFFPKAKRVKYYFLGHPESYVEIIASSYPRVYDATANGDDRSILQYTAFYDMGVQIPSKERSKAFDNKDVKGHYKTEWISRGAIKASKNLQSLKERERNYEKEMKEYALNKLFPLNHNLRDVKLTAFKYRRQSKKDVKNELKATGENVINWGGSAPGTKWEVDIYSPNTNHKTGTLYVSNKIPLKKENMECWTEFYSGGQFEVENKIKDVCFEISQHMFNTWRKMFHDEIIQNRAEGNYKKNMYEEVRNKYIKLITG